MTNKEVTRQPSGCLLDCSSTRVSPAGMSRVAHRPHFVHLVGAEDIPYMRNVKSKAAVSYHSQANLSIFSETFQPRVSCLSVGLRPNCSRQQSGHSAMLIRPHLQRNNRLRTSQCRKWDRSAWGSCWRLYMCCFPFFLRAVSQAGYSNPRTLSIISRLQLTRIRGAV